MTSRAGPPGAAGPTCRPGVVAVVLAVLLGLAAGCGSAPAPTPDPALGSGRSLQRSCPVVAKALRQGFVSSGELDRLASTTDGVVRAGNSETRVAVAPIPDDARALAAAPDSKQALRRFQDDIAALQRACTKQGTRMNY